MLKSLSGNQEDATVHPCGRAFLPWWGGACHEHVIKNLSITLGNIAGDVANSTAAQKVAADSLAKVMLDS